MSHRRVLQSQKENRWITASLEICIYSPVVYLKEALSQKENIILKDLQIRRIQSLIYFLNHHVKGTKAAKAGSVHRDAEQSIRQKEWAGVSKMLIIWLTTGVTLMCDLEIMSRKLKLLKEQSRASECYSESLCCFRTDLLTGTSIFTCKITLLFFLKDLMKICATAWNFPASILLLSDSTADSVLCFTLQ